MLSVSNQWRAAYPGACVGVLTMSSVANPESSRELDAHKDALEADLRARFGSLSRSQIKSDSRLAPYTAYYRRFDKTYHVLHQLESVVLKGKSIPRVAALVEAMFMAELKNGLLTAGHDLDAVRGEPSLDVATGAESYLTLGGEQQPLKPGDMFIHDEDGVLSSILYGPDRRTRIVPTTTRVLFTVYAPAGIPIDTVRAHLDDLSAFVVAVSQAAHVEHLEVICAAK